MRNIIRFFILSFITTCSFILPVNAQTKIETSQKYAPPPPPPLPVSGAVVNQARAQIDGNFGYMDRSSVGGQIQDVWNDTNSSEGVFEYTVCQSCVYKVRVREFMVTSVILPKGVKIHSYDVGDSSKFEVKKRADNILVIQPSSGGLDTSMQVYTKSGDVFPFYLRAEGFNSNNVPDLVVKIKAAGLIDRPLITSKPLFIDKNKNDGDPQTPLILSSDQKENALEDLTSSIAPSDQNLNSPINTSEDFIKTAAFDPDKLHGWGDYELWGDESLRPEAVFRDDHFTYIQFGDKWNDLELPTAYVVIDEIDELVNTRIQGRTFIVENTSGLITLKSGQSFMCIQYGGKT